MRTYAGFRRHWQPPREGETHPAIEEFVESKLAHYARDRDFPARDATSRLSPLIASGEITVADCAAAALAAPPGEGREKWLDEIAWHEWFEHVKSSGLDAPRTEPRWDSPGEGLARWQAGETGFPFVDAGMRELAGTGWMHNRARMVTASFLHWPRELVNNRWDEIVEFARLEELDEKFPAGFDKKKPYLRTTKQPQ